jgi:hypothetical protein
MTDHYGAYFPKAFQMELSAKSAPLSRTAITRRRERDEGGQRPENIEWCSKFLENLNSFIKVMNTMIINIKTQKTGLIANGQVGESEITD